MRNLPPIEDIIPHRGTMLLLDRVIAFENESTTAEYSPRDDSWYTDDQGNMPAWMGIELMAQTVAAHVSLLKRSENTPLQPGVLLGTRSYRSKVPCFNSDALLCIHVIMIYRDPGGLGAYNCSISYDGKELATATIKVFEPVDFQTLVQGNI
jgi:predicted hotdog family 3-hydroxylacyl-ACP dehydratase